MKCVCGCHNSEVCADLDFGPALMRFEFLLPQAETLMALVDVALFALREKSLRLAAMEPSWTIGADDLRMLRQANEEQIEKGHALKHFLIETAPNLNLKSDLH